MPTLQLYETLAAAIPAGGEEPRITAGGEAPRIPTGSEPPRIAAFAAGLRWFAVLADTGGLGLAMTPAGVAEDPPDPAACFLADAGEAGEKFCAAHSRAEFPPRAAHPRADAEFPPTIAGAPLHTAALLAARSWGTGNATLGVAALNAWHNTDTALATAFADTARWRVTRDTPNAFDALLPRLRGATVSVIGHFRDVERLADHCSTLHVLERRPQRGDLPDPACEYVLPASDYVFITGATLANKTLPRLLELSERAYTAVIGPSVTLSPALFAAGADFLGGSVSLDPAATLRAVQEGGGRHNFSRLLQSLQIEKA